jgi:hypothetical protein
MTHPVHVAAGMSRASSLGPRSRSSWVPDGAAAVVRNLGLVKIIVDSGVVDTRLFLGTADLVLVGQPDGRLDTLSRAGPGKESP